MKKLIVLSLITAVMLLMAGFSAPAHAQSPANDLKPTFISPTPGLYVNGWPAFTVSYPKEWVEVPAPAPGNVFRPGCPDRIYPHSPVLAIGVSPSPLPLEDWAKIFMPYLYTDRHGHQGPLRQTLPVEGWHPGPGGRSRICPQR